MFAHTYAYLVCDCIWHHHRPASSTKVAYHDTAKRAVIQKPVQVLHLQSLATEGRAQSRQVSKEMHASSRRRWCNCEALLVHLQILKGVHAGVHNWDT